MIFLSSLYCQFSKKTIDISRNQFWVPARLCFLFVQAQRRSGYKKDVVHGEYNRKIAKSKYGRTPEKHFKKMMQYLSNNGLKCYSYLNRYFNNDGFFF